MIGLMKNAGFSFLQNFLDIRKPLRFNWIRYLIFLFIFAGIEFSQMWFGESITVFVGDTIFIAMVLLVLHLIEFYSGISILIFLYEVAETGAWYLTGDGITFRAMSAVDFAYSIQVMPGSMLIMLLGFCAIVALCYFPFGGKQSILINPSVLPMLLMVTLTLGYLFVMDKINVLYPFREVSAIPMSSSASAIKNSFANNRSVTLRSGLPRNLIMLEVESMESGSIGKFNQMFPKSMPWISSLTENYSYFTNIKSQPYTTWSAAGMFVAECGFPLLQDDVHWNVRQHGDFDAYTVPCIPSFLQMMGYKLFAYCTGSCEIMNMKKFMRTHHYRVQDTVEHHKDTDEVLFQMLEDDVLVDLQDEKNQPFMLLVLNDDTHFTDFRIAAHCDDYLMNEAYPQALRSFTCFDQIIKKFTKRIRDLKLDKNTELVIFGDHLTMGDVYPVYGPQSGRSLSVFFPFRKQDELWEIGRKKRISYYDLAPTIMELLNLDYSPPFPFGANMFGPNEGTVPTLDDFRYIYSILTGDETYSSVRCLGRDGFCQGDEY